MKITTIIAMQLGGPDALVAELNGTPGVTSAAQETADGLTTLTCDVSGDGVSLVRRIVQARGGIVTQVG